MSWDIWGLSYDCTSLPYIECGLQIVVKGTLTFFPKFLQAGRVGVGRDESFFQRTLAGRRDTRTINMHCLWCAFFLRYVKTYDSICNNDNNKSNMFPSPFCNTKAYQCLSSVGIFSSVVAMFPFL